MYKNIKHSLSNVFVKVLFLRTSSRKISEIPKNKEKLKAFKKVKSSCKISPPHLSLPSPSLSLSLYPLSLFTHLFPHPSLFTLFLHPALAPPSLSVSLYSSLSTLLSLHRSPPLSLSRYPISFLTALFPNVYVSEPRSLQFTDRPRFSLGSVILRSGKKFLSFFSGASQSLFILDCWNCYYIYPLQSIFYILI